MQRFRSARYRQIRPLTSVVLSLFAGTLAFGQAGMPLPEGLKQLNQKRGLYFLYDQQVVARHRVSVVPDWTLNTELLLTQFLQGSGLAFRKLGDCYLIEAPPAASTPLILRPAPARRFTISGHVTEQNSGERLAGATVFVPGQTGTITNIYGYFALSLPAAGNVDLVVSLVGYQRAYHHIRLDQDKVLTIDLPNNEELNEVVLTAEANERAGASAQTSQHTPTLTTLRNAPALAGEKDVLKTLQWLPGIQKGLDGQVGLHVRGGGADQNLLILDEAPVYNATHLFGFLSVFSTDALKSVRVQKGGFSAQYGGRLSSVVEMTMREGNRQRLGGEAGTGLIASRLLLEGPLLGNKASFIITARRSNFDPLMGRFVAGLVNAYTGANWRANFYDLNAKINVDLNRRNQLYLSSYTGRDFFGGGDRLDSTRRWENAIGWGNTTGTLRWNHLFSERLFSNLSLIYSQYGFSTTTRYIPYESGVTGSTWRHFNRLTDYALKYDLDYFPMPNHQVRAGFTLNERVFRLNGHEINTPDESANRTHVDPVHSLETALYVADDWAVSDRLRLNLGGRLTRYGVQNRTFWRAEPRLSLSLKLTNRLALQTSYAEMNQFVHQLTNTGQGLPTDLWVPANALVKPQRSRQGVLAVVADVAPRWQLSVEGFRKQMEHIIGYHPNADFIGVTNALNAETVRWERNVTSGSGHATGVEVLLQRKTGRLSGWAGYTWATTRWQFDELNSGRAFFPLHDRRHTVAVNGSYAFSPTLRLSGAWQFSTGNPQSVAVLQIPTFTHLGLGKPNSADGAAPLLFGTPDPLLAGQQLVSGFRAEPTHRLDVSIHKSITAGAWSHQFDLTITNAYGRRNPFYYEYHPVGDERAGLKRVSLFVFLPSLNYTLRF